ncbi:hypothetical protein QYE76_046035 [Lolium multiflorum]|uniref:aldehyde oxygenase (deformylating) n=1 Tax=Lolium multiflorum TaxID=4521 RepID=A0AAD8WY07_LOLMU|nr:hypothetical protein QYE76_046035 [Lolium multiflorum]
MAGPAIIPCHVTTLWLWFAMLQVIAIDLHSGFDFPFNPTNFIPFYGGARHHDYHHRVGNQSNFAPTFTYCDYLYGTDKGYTYHNASLEELPKEMTENNVDEGQSNHFNNRKFK